MDWLRTTAADGFAARVSVGVWIAALIGSWGLGIGAIAAALRRGRRVAPALRRATAACIVELLGLVGMVFLDNPGRWSSRAWLVSLSPVALAIVAVALAAGRGDELVPAPAGERP
jgi:hypothetical protein